MDQPQTPALVDVSKVDVQFVMQNLMQAQKSLAEDRRAYEKRLQEERENAAREIARIRREADLELVELRQESGALARALGRNQAEVDRLREENAVLRSKLAPAEKPAEPALDASSVSCSISADMKPVVLHVPVVPMVKPVIVSEKR